MAVLASIVLTPLIVYVWSRAFPVRSDPEFAAIDYQTLKKRNGWIDLIATAMMFAGLAAPFLLIPFVRKENAMWLIGVAIGSMVIFHFLWVCAATRSFGGQRAREFWRFYELRWGIGIAGIKFVYIPLGVLGIVSAVMVWR
jgi:hypothetical protein